MAWTAPRTWTTGETVTASLMNTHVRDNLAYLKTHTSVGGTSFPGSPATGERFFRTDLGLECYYDGTRWLTVNQYTVGEENNQEKSATGWVSRGIWSINYGVYVEKVEWAWKVLTTLNASHYWTLTVYSYDASGDNARLGIEASTSTGEADTGYVTAVTIGATKTTHHQTHGLVVYKNGSPGNIQASGLIYYRLIIT